MFDELAIARADGRLSRLMASWARIDVLVIDDFLIRPLNSDQAADLLEVIEDRAVSETTRAPNCTVLTPGPTRVTTPIASWPRVTGYDIR